jgi:hypothetical protein
MTVFPNAGMTGMKKDAHASKVSKDEAKPMMAKKGSPRS